MKTNSLCLTQGGYLNILFNTNFMEVYDNHSDEWFFPEGKGSWMELYGMDNPKQIALPLELAL